MSFDEQVSTMKNNNNLTTSWPSSTSCKQYVSGGTISAPSTVGNKPNQRRDGRQLWSAYNRGCSTPTAEHLASIENSINRSDIHTEEVNGPRVSRRVDIDLGILFEFLIKRSPGEPRQIARWKFMQHSHGHAPLSLANFGRLPIIPSADRGGGDLRRDVLR